MIGSFVQFLLLIRCEGSLNSLVRFAHSFVYAILHNSWIKIVRTHQPWSNLYLLQGKCSLPTLNVRSDWLSARINYHSVNTTSLHSRFSREDVTVGQYVVSNNVLILFLQTDVSFGSSQTVYYNCPLYTICNRLFNFVLVSFVAIGIVPSSLQKCWAIY